jgi:hypothetical protein
VTGGLRAHRRVENELAALVRAHGLNHSIRRSRVRHTTWHGSKRHRHCVRGEESDHGKPGRPDSTWPARPCLQARAKLRSGPPGLPPLPHRRPARRASRPGVAPHGQRPELVAHARHIADTILECQELPTRQPATVWHRAVTMIAAVDGSASSPRPAPPPGRGGPAIENGLVCSNPDAAREGIVPGPKPRRAKLAPLTCCVRSQSCA